MHVFALVEHEGIQPKSTERHQRSAEQQGVIVHLIDGTCELFRYFYGLRRFNHGADRPFGAVTGVLTTVLQMIETGEQGC
jgi:hypothetical protein